MSDSSPFCLDYGGVAIDCGDPRAQHQDGGVVSPAADYTLVPADEGYLDTLTGLTWRFVPLLMQSYSEEPCAALGAEWRLPRRLELISLLDHGVGFPAADAARFGTVDRFWSSAAVDDLVVTIDFGPGTCELSDPDLPLAMRCVKGSPLEQTLTVGDGSVLDSATRLTWSRGVDVAERWHRAIEICLARPQEGCRRWRVPSAKELLSLLDETQRLDRAFPQPSDGERFVWSSTPVAFGVGYVWLLDMETLELVQHNVLDELPEGHVRCVW
jgi:hypothetical protein